MVKVFINDVDRSSSITEGSIRVDEAVDRQGGSASFTIENVAPTEGHEVVIWDGSALTAAVSAGTTVQIAVDDVFADSEKYRVGDALSLGLGTATEEEVTVVAVGVSSITVAMVASSHSAGELLGRRIFGGLISSYATVETSQNTSWVAYEVSCSDYRAFLNRKLINNVWTDQAPHQIVADILNTVNYGVTLDTFDYASDVAIQAQYSETGDGGNPTRATTDTAVGTANGSFPWTYATGTATWYGTLVAPVDASVILGVSSGSPTSGALSFWLRCTDPTRITAISILPGSSTTDVVALTVPTASLSTSWVNVVIQLAGTTGSGTPDWTALDSVTITVTQTASSSIEIDDLRMVGTLSCTANNVSVSGADVGRFAVAFKPAAEALDRLAKQLGWTWYVDTERDVHFAPISTTTATAPFSITETSQNHLGFSASPDVSQLANRVYVRGGKEKSASQTEEQYGDALKTVFFTKESPRSTGPYLYDVVISVDTGAGYAVKTYGIANRDDPASYEFLFNAEEGYITNGTHAVLSATDKLKVVYTYLKPVLIRQDNVASQTALQAFQPGTDGVFEHVIIDGNITSSSVARSYATAHLASYSNALVTVSFTTYQEGLQAGQTLSITKPSHGVTGTYLVQRVSRQQLYGSSWVFSVTCASTILGIVELFQLLLERDLYTDENTSVDVQKSASETITVSDGITATATTTKFRWATASPTSEGAIWDRFSWA